MAGSRVTNDEKPTDQLGVVVEDEALGGAAEGEEATGHHEDEGGRAEVEARLHHLGELGDGAVVQLLFCVVVVSVSRSIESTDIFWCSHSALAW